MSVQAAVHAPIEGEEHLTTADVARLLKISRSSVYELMESGRLAYAKFGRSRRIPRTALRRLIDESLVGD